MTSSRNRTATGDPPSRSHRRIVGEHPGEVDVSRRQKQWTSPGTGWSPDAASPHRLLADRVEKQPDRQPPACGLRWRRTKPAVGIRATILPGSRQPAGVSLRWTARGGTPTDGYRFRPWR